MKPTLRILNFAGVMTSTTLFFTLFVTIWFQQEITITEPNKLILLTEIMFALFFLILCNKIAWEALRGVK